MSLCWTDLRSHWSSDKPWNTQNKTHDSKNCYKCWKISDESEIKCSSVTTLGWSERENERAETSSPDIRPRWRAETMGWDDKPRYRAKVLGRDDGLRRQVKMSGQRSSLREMLGRRWWARTMSWEDVLRCRAEAMGRDNWLRRLAKILDVGSRHQAVVTGWNNVAVTTGLDDGPERWAGTTGCRNTEIPT